ncbi:hypothetical protein HUR95_06930 [Caldalkalibacillus thermarum TA2.A1]|nr:hypothetical protein [Caldalkalibacillus thermarum]QZT34966.1 hypothetical protein HUR95_06930 [Caldalkalibacillus thermarum TA2.A1]
MGRTWLMAILVLCILLFMAGLDSRLSSPAHPPSLERNMEQGFQAANQTNNKAQAKIVKHVLTYAQTVRDDDPFIEAEPGVWVKQSNVEGIVVDGQRYYYSMIPHMSYDPLARGEVSMEDIDILYDEQGEFPVMIYTVKSR